MSELMLKLLARFQYRLVNNIGIKESNEICIKWIKEYSEGGDNGTQSKHMSKQKFDC